MTLYEQNFNDEREAAEVRILEGWIGRWRISIRRRRYEADDYFGGPYGSAKYFNPAEVGD